MHGFCLYSKNATLIYKTTLVFFDWETEAK